MAIYLFLLAQFLYQQNHSLFKAQCLSRETGRPELYHCQNNEQLIKTIAGAPNFNPNINLQCAACQIHAKSEIIKPVIYLS
jgi:hypothetical protein